MLYEKPKYQIKFLSISQETGKLTSKETDGENNEFSGVEGWLNRIFTNEYQFKGKNQKKLVIELKDESNTYQVQIGLETNLSKNIINCLAGGRPKQLYLEFGKKDDNFNVKVFGDSKYLSWNYKHSDFTDAIFQKELEKLLDKKDL